ncbi:hypothetical protein PFICI_00030 [Pestalotiopsis fici W106-1]|uniref:PNPLA domain-containing protein n=1 Tax=Pestalotiopsis fici (strain W106-1 / CGMCC3.15140) TaxID=1229662 RepID=W3XL49_PESFW|nr:uncharacterized protein PFICI_00030 [Pestalotiopsis fici W106-1]ETS86202.1 hypothetical protein PFICI_00030 [Pestalotiopsis fici W106-1]
MSRSAVITLREGGGNSDGADAADVTYLFRTDNHRYRGGPFKEELNPKILDKSTLTIAEACRATSAAPTWFPPVKLRGRKFIDGGVTEHNNPAILAWHESNEMAHRPGDTTDSRRTKGPQVLLSVGTGKTKQPRRFGLYNLILSGRHKLTDTEETHSKLNQFVQAEECLYRRFNVPESNSTFEVKGLDKVKLDACKKKSRGTFWRRLQSSDTTETGSFQDAEAEQTRGGYKPHKYFYKTYEKIRSRAVQYCRSTNTVDNEDPVADIQTCAKRLFALSQQRRNDQDRWKEFQENPNPQSRAPPNLQSQNSLGPANQADSQPNP